MRALVFVAALAGSGAADTAIPGSPRVFTLGCRGGGVEKVAIELPKGRWMLDIAYQAACPYYTAVWLSDGAAAMPIDLVKPVFSRCPLELDKATRVEVTIMAQGSIDCGGKMTIERVGFSPAPAGWSADRCRWMYAGLKSATSLGIVAVRDYIRDLPP